MYKMETRIQPFYNNIENITNVNVNYRQVIYTIPNSMQLVLMSIPVGGDIPMEVHGDVTQFIRIETGTGKAIIDGKTINLTDGSAIVIPPGSKHYVQNTSNTCPLKLYSIYTPPEHDSYTVQLNQPKCS